jgi:hypothetical protein
MNHPTAPPRLAGRVSGGPIGLQNPLPRLILLIFAVGGYHSKIARCLSARPNPRARTRADRFFFAPKAGAGERKILLTFVRGS